jgi:hypothetical protein
MRHMVFTLMIVTAIVMSIGIAGWGQEASADAAATPSDGIKLDVSVDAAWYEAYKWERDATYEYLMTSLLDASGVSQTITTLADLARFAPDAAILQQHVQEIVRLLGGPQENAVVANIPGPTTQWGVGYHLLGAGGQLEDLTMALDSYLSFVGACSDVLIPYKQSKFRETYGPDVWPDYDARVYVDDWLSDLTRTLNDASTLARLALDAALRMDPQVDVEEQTDNLTLIFACAATIGGYWPVPTPFRGATPSDIPAMRPGDPELWYAENVPSLLWSLLRSLRSLDQELADAVAAALGSN